MTSPLPPMPQPPPATQIQLREAIKAAVQSNLTIPSQAVVESRYAPRVDAEGLDELHLAFFLLDVQTETIGRDVDTDEYSIAIAIQQSVPKQRNGDVVHDGDNVTFLDQMVTFTESIKSLFRTNGALRHTNLVGCFFVKMNHELLFEPVHLVRYGVFTSIIELTYKSEEQ